MIGINRAVDEETAREIAKTFIEAIAAPGYSPEALAILAAKKNLRLMRVAPGADPLVVKSISGGYLAQTADSRQTRPRAPPSSKRSARRHRDEWIALEFGWKVAKHVKSNAIVYARAGQAVGVGAGQMSRVDSVKIGAMKAILPLAGTVVASDAFFPFADGVEEAVKNGATAFIQPGGSRARCGCSSRGRPLRRRHGLHRRPPLPPLGDRRSPCVVCQQLAAYSIARPCSLTSKTP